MKTELVYKEKNLPETHFRAGPISATVWKNEVGEVSFSSVSLERRYKDKDGSWKSTKALRVNDLPKAALVLNKAYEHLVMKEKANNTEEGIAY
jgi:hypothetical protein